jgi:hypothetical protein
MIRPVRFRSQAVRHRQRNPQISDALPVDQPEEFVLVGTRPEPSESLDGRGFIDSNPSTAAVRPRSLGDIG